MVLTTRTSRTDQLRVDSIGTGDKHAARLRIGMIERKCAAPGEGVRFGRLARREVDAGRVLTPSIIDGVVELNRAAIATGRGMEGSSIRHSYIRAAGHASDRGRTDRHRNAGHFEWHRLRGRLCC